ncbi:MFS transporter [Streptacidiphilus sp. N1-12]|uniref:MFS transporter n=2 Tax=Streptacidiphilus alkalitolerans TaxID=3342712 RepID=A0ABV6VJQ5_9ACTN
MDMMPVIPRPRRSGNDTDAESTNYRILYAANAVSRIGSAFFPVGLAFSVLDLTGSAADLGYTLGATALAELGFLLVGGAVADRWPRIRILILSTLCSAAIEALAAITLILGSVHIWELVALSATAGLSGAFSRPAAQGLIPTVVPVGGLQRAISQIRLANSTSFVVGPSLAGLFVAATSPGWAVFVDAASYAAILPLLLRLRGRLDTTKPEDPAASIGFLGQIREGWTEFWARPWVWTVVVQSAFVNMGDYAGFSLLMPVAARELYSGASSLGFLISGTGAGFIIGGLVGISWEPRRPLPVSVSYLLGCAAPLLALALQQPFWVVLLATLVGGFCTEQHGVYWDTLLQQHLPQRILSRVYAYDQLGSELFTPVGYFFGGAVVASMGLLPSLWICVGLIAVPTVLVFTLVAIRGSLHPDSSLFNPAR